MSWTLVVGAAPVSGCEAFYTSLLAEAPTVVAADAAGEWCADLGRVPDLVVGDFDSATAGAAQRLAALGARVETHAREKDQTDLELAIDAARAQRDAPIVLTCAFSARLDHTLAAVGALTRAGAGARAVEPGWRAWTCAADAPLHLDAPVRATLSVMAIGDARGVSVTGTEWVLEDAALPSLSGWGVSNRTIGGPVSVSCSAGTLVVLLLEDADAGLY